MPFARVAAERAQPLKPIRPTNPPGDPVVGGTVVVGSVVEPVSLDPWGAPSQVAGDVRSAVLEGLLQVNAAGRLQPALAEGFALAEDGLSYTFLLREGVSFHDGSAFTGKDVVAMWQAMQASSAPLPAGWDRVRDVQFDGDRTLVISTVEPYAPLLTTVGVFPIVPRDLVSDGLDGYAQLAAMAPVGTGPFRLTSWVAGEGITLERFAAWWGGEPMLDGIDYRVLPDASALLQGLNDGSIDVTGGAGGVPLRDVEGLLEVPGVTVWEHPTANWRHIDLKQVGFLRETAVRQALDFATPKQQLIDSVLGGRAVPAFADQMPDSWAAHPTLQPRPYDPEQAKRIMAEAGFAPGADGVLARDGVPFRIELWGLAADPDTDAMLPLIATAWSEIGVAVRVRQADASVLWGPLGYQFSDQMTACLYTWTNGVDPDDLFYWHSSQIPTSPTAPGGNTPAFFHPYGFQAEIDELTAAGASTLDVARRVEIYRRIQEILRGEVPVIFVCWDLAYPANRLEVGGFWPGPHTGLLWNAGGWSIHRPSGSGDATPVP